MTNIVFFEIEKWEEKYLKKQLKGHTLTFIKEPLGKEHKEIIKKAQVLSVFIYSKVSAQMVALMPKLKLITTRSTGFDHIDLTACKKKKIVVANVPYYGENTVAEHTFALILSLSRNLHKAYVRTLQGDFSVLGLQGFDLKDKTIGIIGAGHIGLRVIKMAKGFGMHAMAYDIKQDDFLAEVLRYQYVDLDTLLSSCDIISLHAPLNKYTKHIINMKNVANIKRGALLINTARGGLIDTDALIYALDKQIIAGAGLDVLEKEELLRKHDQFTSKNPSPDDLGMLFKNQNLLHRDNVVITPHLAFDSKEALQRILDTSIQNILSYLQGTLHENIVGS